MKPDLKCIVLTLLMCVYGISIGTAFARQCTPTITASDGNTSLCSSPSITLTASDAATYRWSTGATTQTITVPVAGDYTVTTVDGSGCEGTSEVYRIAPKPDASIDDPVDNFTNCGFSASSSSFDLTVENTSTTRETNTSYTIAWGDGRSDTYGKNFSTASHTYTQVGSFDLVLTVTGQDGCTSTTTKRVFSGSNPGIGIASRGNTGDCTPASFIFDISRTENNPEQTVYKIWFDDGSDTLYYTHKNLPKEIEHTFYKSSQGMPNNEFTAFARAINPCRATEARVGGILVSKGPIAKFSPSQTGACVGTVIKMTDQSEGGFNASQSNSNYTRNWVITPSTGWTYTAGTRTAPTPSIKFLEPGDYNVKIVVKPVGSNTKCTGDSTQQVITITGAPTANFTLVPDAELFCANSVVRVNNTSTGNNISYSWAVSPATGWAYATGSGASSADPGFNFTAPGNYTLILTASNGCSPNGVKSKTITITGKPTAMLPAAQVYCGPQAISFSATNALHQPTYDASFGTITGYNWQVRVISGDGEFAFTEDSGSNVANPIIDFTKAGVYEVSVAAVNACGASAAPATQRITINPLPELAVVAAKAELCIGERTTLTASGADTYTWSPAAGLSATTGKEVTANPTQTTTYTVTGVNSSTKCASTTTFTVVVHPLPEVMVSSSTPEICLGQGTATLTASGADTYTWLPAAGLSNTEGGQVTAAPSETTTYTVTGFNTATGCSSTATVTVKVNPLPVVLAGRDLVICDKPVPTQLSGNPAGGTWSGPYVSPEGQFIPDGKGVFTLTYTYTDAKGCTNSDQLAITVSEVLVADAGEDKEVCLNSGALVLKGNYEGGIWSGLPHVTADGTFNPSNVGTYTITYTYYTGTCFTTDELLVTVKPLPAAPTASAGPICYNSATTIQASTASVLRWYNQNGDFLQEGSSLTTPTLTATTDYFVEATADNGCPSPRTKVTVVVREQTPAPVVAPAAICGPGRTTLLAEGPAEIYEWFEAATGEEPIHTGRTFPTPTLTQTTSFYVQGVTAGCAGPRVQITVTVHPLLENNVLQQIAAICYGQTAATITGAPPTGGDGTYTYRWESSINSGSTGFTTINGATGSTYAPGAPGRDTWYRRVVVSAGCELTSDAVQLVVTPVVSNNTISGAQYICAGQTPVQLQGSAPAGGNGSYTFRWESSTNGTAFTAITNTDAAYFQPEALQTSTWFRRVVISGTCSEAVSAAVKITILPAISNNTVTGAQTVCQDAPVERLMGSTPVGGDGSYTFRWEKSTDNGSSYTAATGTNTLKDYAPGTLTATTLFRRMVTSTTCEVSYSEPLEVLVNPVIENNVIAGTQTICAGEALQAILGEAPAGGDGSYTYQWEKSTDDVTYTAMAGATEATYQPTNESPVAWYRRKVISGACSSYSNKVKVTIHALPAAPVVAPVAICAGGKATLTATGNGSTYRWYSQVTGGTALETSSSLEVENLQETVTYYVEAISSNNCISSTRTAVTVTVYPVLASNTIAAPKALICAGDDAGTLTGSAPAGGNGSYTFRWEKSTDNGSTYTTLSNSNSATYSPGSLSTTTLFRRVVISSPCASLASEAVQVQVLPLISNNTISRNQTICAGDIPAELTGEAPAGGDGSYTYTWQMSTDNGNSYTAIDNSDDPDYQPLALQQTTLYRRVVRSGPCAESTSAAVTIAVTPVIENNQLAPLATAQIICVGEIPQLIPGKQPTGGTNAYTYTWERSENGTDFTSLINSNTPSYQPRALQRDTWFRRLVVSGTCSSTSDAILVKVNEAILNNGVAAVAEICAGTAPDKLVGTTPAGGDGSYTYTWEMSTQSGTSGFTAAPAPNTDMDYSPGTLTTSTWFRRKVSSGGCSNFSVATKVIVNPNLATNTVVADQNIYAGTIPATLAGSLPSGGNGSYVFQWESSTDGLSFEKATGASMSRNYSPAALTVTTFFHRVVTSGGCEMVSNVVQVRVIPVITDNVVNAPQTICTGNAPVRLTGTAPTGGEGNYLYRWEVSTLGETGGFTTAQGTNNEPGYSPGLLYQNTWYRRVVMSGQYTHTSQPIKVTVNPALSNNRISTSQTICFGTAPAVLTGAVPAGGSGNYTYLWESSTDGATVGFSNAAGMNTSINYNPSPLTQTTWFRRVVSSESCARSVSEAVVLNITPLPAAPAVAGTLICSGGSAALTATGKGGRLEWYNTATGGLPIFVGATYVTPNLTRSTTYYVQEVTLSCASERRAVTVTVTEPTANAGRDVIILRGRSTTLEASGGVSYRWSPAIGLNDANIAAPMATPQETTTYTLTVTTAASCVFQDEVTVTVLPHVVAPNTFTPNRDGINDTWVIENLSDYPNCKVEVFNQWGNQVYRSEGYKEPWDGRYNGKELPLATYYYIIHLDNKEKPLTGSVTIVK